MGGTAPFPPLGSMVFDGASRAELLDVVGQQDDGDPVTADALRQLSAVEDAESATFMFAAMLPADGVPLDAILFGGSILPSGTRLVEGRAADPELVNEFVLTAGVADERDLSIGDRVTLVT